MTTEKSCAQPAERNPMVPFSAIRPIAVEAIRAVTGCPDIRGNEGRYLVDELESVAKAACEAFQAPEGAALAAQPRAVTAWQPIETAPKDMRAYLFRVNGYAVQGFVDATGVHNVQNERGEWRKMRGAPSHWMPLPAAPQTKEPTNDR